MSTDLTIVAQVVRRRYYQGLFFGGALGLGVAAVLLHATANPEIAESTATYTAQQRSHHRTLLDLRNYTTLSAGLSLVVSFWLYYSVDRLLDGD
jgi:hypothetical protein